MQLIKLSQSDVEVSNGFLNSATHIIKEPKWIFNAGEQVCHSGALSKMPELLEGLRDNDFVVLDMIMENRPARALSSALLGSTVWFDSGNGQAFMTHSNDGFVFEAAHKLGKVRYFVMQWQRIRCFMTLYSFIHTGTG
jgi:hypothetical protein